MLFVKGHVEKLIEPQIAMVGSHVSSLQRAASRESPSPRVCPKRFGGHTSGLALGIDGYTHDGALDKGGETFCGVGFRLGLIYPARHRESSG
ncbi:DNA-processing protein DprA [Vibrio lentus]|nr:DNA-processing protein DprA [Vibrio lentus]